MDNRELRSENVRKVIGQKLPPMVRNGITLAALLVAVLLALAFLLPLPDTSGGAHPENAGKTFYERLQCSFSDNLSVRK